MARRYGDFSSWQPSLDQNAYRRTFDTVMLRSGDGPGFTDPTIAARWSIAAGLYYRNRGAYHFARPGDGKGQAQAHLSRSPGFLVGDVHMLDCEYFTTMAPAGIAQGEVQIAAHGHEGDFVGEQGAPSSIHRAGDPELGIWPNHLDPHDNPESNALTKTIGSSVGLPPDGNAKRFVQAFFSEVHAAHPQAGLLIYANAWWLEAAGIEARDLFGAVGWVVAAYASTYPGARGWPHACGWQYTDSASCPGVSGGVDFNQVTCPNDWHHLFPTPKPLEPTVAEEMPILRPGDVGHNRFYPIATTGLQGQHWPMPAATGPSDTFFKGIKIVQAYNGKPATGIVDAETWKMCFGTGKYAGVKPPVAHKVTALMENALISEDALAEAAGSLEEDPNAEVE
jgi:hypothetical protein